MIPNFSYIRARSVDKAVRYLSPDDARVHGGGTEAENIIKGRQLDRDRAAKVAATALKNAEPMEQNEYKMPLFRGLIEHQLMDIAYPNPVNPRINHTT